jgi:hypothetical protein
VSDPDGYALAALGARIAEALIGLGWTPPEDNDPAAAMQARLEQFRAVQDTHAGRAVCPQGCSGRRVMTYLVPAGDSDPDERWECPVCGNTDTYPMAGSETP